MGAFLLVILYLLDGSKAVLEQKVYSTKEACMEAGEAKLGEIMLDQHKDVIEAGCIAVEGQVVSSK